MKAYWLRLKNCELHIFRWLFVAVCNCIYFTSQQILACITNNKRAKYFAVVLYGNCQLICSLSSIIILLFPTEINSPIANYCLKQTGNKPDLHKMPFARALFFVSLMVGVLVCCLCGFLRLSMVLVAYYKRRSSPYSVRKYLFLPFSRFVFK